MCKNENWSVRTLRERKKTMLYERTAVSKLPEETIANEIAELRDDKKMSLDMFYRDHGVQYGKHDDDLWKS